MLRLRCVGASSSTASAAAATVSAVAAAAARTISVSGGAKGRCEYRLDYTHSLKRGNELLRDIKDSEARRANPAATTKKERLAHLLERPKYEYTPDFQRAADDMMAVQSDPRKFISDMSYHYKRVGKMLNGSQTWVQENSSCGMAIKIQGPN
jgi:hypothetical protein